MAPTSLTESYWAAAFALLDPDCQNVLASTRTGKLDVLRAVLDTAEQKRQLCIRKQWKAKLPTGHTVIVRDVLEKIARWIKNFVVVGDVAIQFNTQSAALPWAAVRFILQAAISHTQVEGAIVSDLETVSRLVSRYREFERVHLQRESSIKPQLAERLTRLYADILTYLATVVKYFGRSTMGRITRNVLQDPSNGQISRILQQETELLHLAGLSNAEMLNYLEQSVTRLIDVATTDEKLLDENTHFELLRWLSAVPVTFHHELKSNARMAGSAKWLFSHGIFRDWKNSSSSATFILYGIRGSGKSTTFSAVVDSFINVCRTKARAVPAAYFYCANQESEPERASPSEVLRSLLKQLIVSNSQELAVRRVALLEYERRLAQSKLDGMDLQKLDVKGCVNLMQQITATDPVVILIDALDELPPHGRTDLVDALTQIVNSSANVVKIFLTARDNSHLSALLPDIKQGSSNVGSKDDLNVAKVRIERHHVSKDIEAYVELRLSSVINGRRLLRGKASPELIELLQEELVKGAGEMFQWVNMQLEFICHQTCAEDIIDHLNGGNLPDLDNTYSAIFDHLIHNGNTSRQIVIRAFAWLIYAKEPVPSSDFLRAVALQALTDDPALDSDALIDICSNMILLDSTCDVFRFSHQSVYEFLRNQEQISSDSAHLLLCTICLDICRNGQFFEGHTALYRYAALYWPHHYYCATIEERVDELHSAAISFIFDDPGDVSLAFVDWISNVEQLARDLADDHSMKSSMKAIPNKESSPLFMAGLFGLTDLIQVIVSTSDDIDLEQRNDLGHTAFYLACANGHTSAAELFLAHGSDATAKCGKFGNPLQAACFAGHNSMVTFLLSQGTPIHQRGTFTNALEAAYRGHNEETALIVLNDPSAVRNSQEYESAIEGAVQYGFLKAIEFLERSSTVNLHSSAASERMKAKCTKAVREGQMGVLKHFLERQVDPAAVLTDDILVQAAIYGHGPIIEMLVGIGISLEAEGKLGTPLRCACLMGRQDIVVLLLGLGAKLDSSSPHGGALQAASMKGHRQICMCLIEAGAEVNSQTGLYGTALQAAAYHGHLDTVELLLNSKAKVELSGIARDAIHAAAEGGHHHIVKYFLGRGFSSDYDPPRAFSWFCGITEEPDWEARSMQYSIDEITSEDVLSSTQSLAQQDPRLIVAADPYHDRREDDLPYILELSASRGNNVTVTDLLDRTDDWNIRPHHVEEALAAAVLNGHADVIDSLIQAITRPVLDRAVLENAVKYGSSAVFDLVLTKMDPGTFDAGWMSHLVEQACLTDVQLVDKVVQLARKHIPADDMLRVLRSGLNVASKNGRVPVVEWLMSWPGLTSPHTISGAIVAACKDGHQSTVHSLLASCDPKNVMTDSIYEALVTSAENGHLDLMIYIQNNISAREEQVSLTSPLLAAAPNGHLSVVNYLLAQHENWASYSSDITVALVVAAFHGQYEVVEALHGAGANVHEIIPLRNTDRGISKTDRSLMWKPDDPGGTTIIVALSAHYDYDTRPGTENTSVNSLQACLSRFPVKLLRHETEVLRYEKTVRLLLSLGADANHLGGYHRLPLQVAASRCTQPIVQWLIEAGADVHAVSSGRTALLAAVERRIGTAGIVQLLLESGAGEGLNGDSFSHLLKTHVECPPYGYPSVVLTVSRTLLERSSRVQHTTTTEIEILQEACSSNDSLCVQLLLEKGVDVNASGCHRPVLQTAISHGHVDVARQLLQWGANPNSVYSNLPTALQLAVESDRTAMVEYLLHHHGADINKLQTNSNVAATPLLSIAAKYKNAEMISMLVDAGADVTIDPKDHLHPLIVASASGDPPIVERLLKAGAPSMIAGSRKPFTDEVMSHERSPLHMACYHGHEGVAQLLVDHGVDPNAASLEDSFPTPLMLAARNGHTSTIDVLLKAGALPDIDLEGVTALCRAVEGGHIDAISCLMAAGAVAYDEKRGINILCHIQSSLSAQILEVLLEETTRLPDGHGAILEAYETALRTQQPLWVFHGFTEYISIDLDVLDFHRACISGSSDIVQEWLSNGMAVDAEDGLGNRPLTWAARYLHPDIVQRLLDHGAEINHQSKHTGNYISAALLGYCEAALDCGPVTPDERVSAPHRLLRAFSRERSPYGMGRSEQTRDKCENVVKQLFNYGIGSQSEASIFGSTLHVACLAGIETIVGMLLSRGLDVNHEAGFFKYPLFAALHQGHEGVVRLLLQNRVDPDTTHPHWGSALSFACESLNTKPSVIQTMLEHGANPNVRSPVTDNTPITAIISNEDYSSAQRLYWKFTQEDLVEKCLATGIVKISDQELLAAARWTMYGDYTDGSIMEKLLAYDRNVIVPEAAILVALERESVADMPTTLKLMLERRGSAGVTAAMIEKVQHLSRIGILSVMLNHRPRCRMTQAMVETQSDWKRMKLFMDAETGLIPTQRMLTRSVQPSVSEVPGLDAREPHLQPRGTRLDLMREMFRRNPDLEVTEGILQNMGDLDEAEVQFLLSEKTPALRLPQDAILNADAGILRLLLMHEPDIRIEDDTVVSGLQSQSDGEEDYLDVLLRHDPTLRISDEIFLAAFNLARRSSEGNNGPELADLLKRHGRKVYFSDKLRSAIDIAFWHKDDVSRAMRQAYYDLSEPRVSPVPFPI